MAPVFELRFAVDMGTSTVPPKLQFRHKDDVGNWGEWTDVPLVAINIPPSMVPIPSLGNISEGSANIPPWQG